MTHLVLSDNRFFNAAGGKVDSKSGAGGPSYLVDSWQQTFDWIGQSHLTIFFLGTAISRFYLNMCRGDRMGRIDEPVLTVTAKKRTTRSAGT
jgi:hypothetical protein